MAFWLAALSIGFVGSFHCVGMCGPIALALPLGNRTKVSRFLGIALYNIGRILTYTLMGMVFGVFGKGFVIGGYQQILSILLGVLLLAGLLLPAGISGKWNMTKIITHLVIKVKSLLSGLLVQKSNSSLFLIGTLNGLLPCGLVYLAVAGAIATGSVSKGGLFMAAFGLGTAPAMFSVALVAGMIKQNVRTYIQKAVPVFVAVMAFGLILRGLNLGIPYVSPQLDKADCTKHSCCNKK